MTQIDEAKRGVSHFAPEMAHAIRNAIEGLYGARKFSEQDQGPRGKAYREAIGDALKLLRPAREAVRQFDELLLREALSDEERGALAGCRD